MNIVVIGNGNIFKYTDGHNQNQKVLKDKNIVSPPISTSFPADFKCKMAINIGLCFIQTKTLNA